MRRVSLEGGDNKLKLCKMKSEWLEDLSFDLICILSLILLSSGAWEGFRKELGFFPFFALWSMPTWHHTLIWKWPFPLP